MFQIDLIYQIADNQGWSFPLESPLVLQPKDVEDWGEFQLWLKVVGYINQSSTCICGREIINFYLSDLHHALITRRDYRGNIIHSSYNVVVCHKECHPKLNREQCFNFLANIFGVEAIYTWYNSTRNQMKGTLRNLP